MIRRRRALILRNDCLAGRRSPGRKQIADVAPTKLPASSANLALRGQPRPRGGGRAATPMRRRHGFYRGYSAGAHFPRRALARWPHSFSFDASASGWGSFALGGDFNSPTL